MKTKHLLLFLFILTLFSCSAPVIRDYQNLNTEPDIYPDYKGVTIPVNIAPLNFRLNEKAKQALLLIEGENKRIEIASSDGKFIISANDWKSVLTKNSGSSIRLTVYKMENEQWKKYTPFSIHIAAEPADPYLVYRLIEPGYELWETMGIFQTNIETGEETAIYENKQTAYNCVNCHSFNRQNPDEMLFHMRGNYNGTFIAEKGKIEVLDTKTDSTISSFVYPAWHPSGKFIAFSVNKIAQSFYQKNSNRLEVFDSKSDVVIFNRQTKETYTSQLISGPDRLETFPFFSNDGKTLFFCSSKQWPVPEKSDSVKYSLCAVSFDEEHETFGKQVDTLFNTRVQHKSVSFPRMSPDGRFLLFTVTDYGTFPIWHREADLKMYDLKENRFSDMALVNSDNTESYHSWSSNSRWFVFSSRRDDGLYTRLYLAYIGDDGNPAKAFMLPQKDPDFYDSFMKSYNIPEFVKSKVKLDGFQISKKAKSGKKENVGFLSKTLNTQSFNKKK